MADRPDPFAEFEDVTHDALRVAHDAITQAALEAQQSVARVTHEALLVAYQRIDVAARRYQSEVSP